MNTLDAPVNITNGPKGIDTIDSIHFFGIDLGKDHSLFGLEFHSVTMYYYLFVALVIFAVLICYRLERSRIGRAWMAIRENEIAASSVGVPVVACRLEKLPPGLSPVQRVRFAALAQATQERLEAPPGAGAGQRNLEFAMRADSAPPVVPTSRPAPLKGPSLVATQSARARCASALQPVKAARQAVGSPNQSMPHPCDTRDTG